MITLVSFLVSITAATALAIYVLWLHAKLEATRDQLRGAEYRAAAGWNAWENEKFHRVRSLASLDAEDYDSFATIEQLTTGKR